MNYTIKQGKHNSNLFIPQRLWLGYGVYHISFSFKFLNNPCYEFGTEDDWDINKMLGVSFGKHHDNSFRIGWRPASLDQVSLHTYWYNNGRRYDNFLYIINHGTEVVGNIEMDRYSGEIKTKLFVGGNIIKDTTEFDFEGVSMWSYKLFPYFGGNRVATHDMKIHMDMNIHCKVVI